MRSRRLLLVVLAPALVVAQGACSGDAGGGATTGASSLAGVLGGGGAGGDTSVASGGASAGGTTNAGGDTSAGGGAGGTTNAGGNTSAGGGAGGASPWGPCDVDGVPGECVDVAECTGGHVPTPGHCPGPANIQCCTKQGGGGGAGGAAVCDPAASPEPNVGLAEAPGTGGCPAGMARVSTFCVDVYEAALVDAATGAAISPFHNPGAASTRAVSIAGAIPQAYIDQLQADDACTNAGKRLCTDAEWLRACRGPSDFTYPYGDALEPGVCNDHRAEHPAIEYFGTSADWIWSELGNACLDQLHDTLDPAGTNPGCVTAEGLYDLMGNLHEWTADPAGTFRGGYFVDTVINGPGCLYVTTAHDVSHWDYSTGFRCCADP